MLFFSKLIYALRLIKKNVKKQTINYKLNFRSKNQEY